MTAAISNSRCVVVYNSDGYTLLGRMSLNKALRLIALEKAVVHEIDESRGFLRSSGKNAVEWLYPKAIRLIDWVILNAKFYGKPIFTKHGVLKRDRFKCAYCGKKATTIDHVLPRALGGKNDWKNCVAACFKCNNKKDNLTLKEAHEKYGMSLRWEPRTPTKAELMGM